MALHETFTDNPGLAFLLGPARPDFSLGNTWFGSVSIWGGPIIGFSTAGNPVVEVSVSGIAGVFAVQAEVFGTRVFDGTGLASVHVTTIEWSLPGSSTILARYTFDIPLVFPLSVSRFVGDLRFVDILTEVISAGGSPQLLFDDYFQNADTLVGGAATDILYGGFGNDVIDGGGGNDSLRGDSGNDTFIYRSGDAAIGEQAEGGSGTDKIVAVGAAIVSHDVFIAGNVNLFLLNISSIEEVHTNGTEVVLDSGQVGFGGFNTLVGRTGFADQLMVLNTASLDLNLLTLINWDLASDRVVAKGTLNGDFVNGTAGRDVFIGDSGADTLNGNQGDDRFLILEGETTVLDSISGGDGNDVLQLDGAAIASVLTATLTDLRSMSMTGVEVLDIVKGSFGINAAQFVGAIGGSLAAPVVNTLGLNRVIGNGTNAQPNTVLLEIYLGNLLGLDLRSTVFENWNDGFFIDKRVGITAGFQTRIIYCPNEETRVNALAAMQGVFITGGNQVDEIYGSQFADYVDGGQGGDYVFGLDGSDGIGGGTGSDTIYGGLGDDTLFGAEDADQLSGDAGNDYLRGGLGDDILDGGDNDDLLNGSAGADTIYGGTSGTDTASYVDAAAGVSANLTTSSANTGDAAGDSYTSIENLQGSSFSDSLYGDAGSNVLYGGQEGDLLSGRGGNDSIYGELGNDTLLADAGNDVVDGGDGTDRLVFNGSTAISVNLGLTTAQATGMGDDTLLNIESVVTGTGDDRLTGNDAANHLSANDGNDTLSGGAGNDSLFGSIGNDILNGGAGNDLIDGGIGIDRAIFNGTAGATVNLTTVGAQDTGYGTDTLTGIENLVSGSGNDRLGGNDLDNTLSSGSGNDTLSGGLGNDVILAGDGNDVIFADAGDDTFDGGLGIDRLVFSSNGPVKVQLSTLRPQVTGDGTDTILDIENLTTGAGNDRITGSTADNTLISGAGSDTLRGDAGADILQGGTGNDILTGGLDRDAFVFNTAIGAANIDRITDFTVADDTIRLDDAIFTALTAGALAGTAFVANLSGLAGNGNHQIIYETDTGALFYDADGNGAIATRQQIATLTANLALTAADFTVI